MNLMDCAGELRAELTWTRLSILRVVHVQRPNTGSYKNAPRKSLCPVILKVQLVPNPFPDAPWVTLRSSQTPFSSTGSIKAIPVPSAPECAPYPEKDHPRPDKSTTGHRASRCLLGCLQGAPLGPGRRRANYETTCSWAPVKPALADLFKPEIRRCLPGNMPRGTSCTCSPAG
jgi:hypothetical protein